MCEQTCNMNESNEGWVKESDYAELKQQRDKLRREADTLSHLTALANGAVLLARQQRDKLLTALKDLVDETEEPPDSNCSCHINPPCADCVNYAHMREVLCNARKAIAKAVNND